MSNHPFIIYAVYEPEDRAQVSQMLHFGWSLIRSHNFHFRTPDDLLLYEQDKSSDRYSPLEMADGYMLFFSKHSEREFSNLNFQYKTIKRREKLGFPVFRILLDHCDFRQFAEPDSPVFPKEHNTLNLKPLAHFDEPKRAFYAMRPPFEAFLKQTQLNAAQWSHTAGGQFLPAVGYRPQTLDSPHYDVALGKPAAPLYALLIIGLIWAFHIYKAPPEKYYWDRTKYFEEWHEDPNLKVQNHVISDYSNKEILISREKPDATDGLIDEEIK